MFFVDARYLISHQSFNIRFFRVTWRESGNIPRHGQPKRFGCEKKVCIYHITQRHQILQNIYIILCTCIYIYIYNMYIYMYICVNIYIPGMFVLCVSLYQTVKIDNSNIKENWLAHRLDWGEWFLKKKSWQDERWLNPGCLFLDLRICSSIPIMMVIIFKVLHYKNLRIINQVPTLCSNFLFKPCEKPCLLSRRFWN